MEPFISQVVISARALGKVTASNSIDVLSERFLLPSPSQEDLAGSRKAKGTIATFIAESALKKMSS